jgi:hypothetical protein
MILIDAMEVAADAIVESTLPAQDYASFDPNVTYSEGDHVCATKTYEIGATEVVGPFVFESRISGNLGNDPVTDDGSAWLDKGPTSRLRPFDGTIGSVASSSGSLSFTVVTDRTCDGLALFGLRGGTVRIQVFTAQDLEIFDQTYSLFDPVEISDQYTFWFAERSFVRSKPVLGLPKGAGKKVKVTVDAGTGIAELGSLVLGTKFVLGITRPGTEPGYQSFSQIGRDDYGNLKAVRRGKVRTVKFRYDYETPNTGKILRRMMESDGKLVVALQGNNDEKFGTLVYGIIRDAQFPSDHVYSEGIFEMDGVVE